MPDLQKCGGLLEGRKIADLAHTYYVPVVPGRGRDGRGRARTYDWPESVVEVTPESARDLPIDVVLMQRPVELHAQVEQWLGVGQKAAEEWEHVRPFAPPRSLVKELNNSGGEPGRLGEQAPLDRRLQPPAAGSEAAVGAETLQCSGRAR